MYNSLSQENNFSQPNTKGIEQHRTLSNRSTPGVDWDLVRADFPLLSTSMRGKPLVYLDNAATSLKPRQVIDAIRSYYMEYGVNIHRGIYELSERATREYEEVRQHIADWLNCPADGQILFTSGSTEAANLIAYSWGRKFLGPGDRILSTEYEHHSSLVPWHFVCKSCGCQLDFLPINSASLGLDIEAYYRKLGPKVKLLVLSAMSNVTGYIPPLKKIIDLAKANKTIVVIDAAQLAAHCPLDLQDLAPDFLYFSAHKMLGPTGLGVLYANKSLLDSMDPFLYGGNMILKVKKDSSTYHPLPQKFEAGTPNIAGVLGFSAALSYLSKIGMETIAKREQELISYLKIQLASIEGIQSYCPSETQGGILSFNLKGIHSHDLGTLLDEQGIAVRTGFHCAMPLMDWLGISNTVRASLYFYNTKEDIDRLVEGIENAGKVFG